MKKALDGFRAWLIQRLTALYLLVFVVFVLAHFVFHAPKSYVDWQTWVARTPVALAIWLFFAALAMHAWIGMRDVTLDYVGPLLLRILVLASIALALLASLAWASRVLFSVQA